MSEPFAAAYRRATTQTAPGGPEMIGVQLAVACADALSVDGVGLSLFTSDSFRTPIGASSPFATAAERLQFTVGEGPCLDAHTHREPVRASDTELARRWPAFHRELVTKTPFRGIISLPLGHDLAGHAAIDIYFRHPGRILDPTIQQTTAAANTVAALLAEHLRSIPFGSAAIDAWFDATEDSQRAMVSIAMGMVTVAADVTFHDALSLLRAHAYATDTSLDQLSTDLVTGRKTTHDLELGNW
ncbi:hypothetical protein H4P1_00092 (plasmid) [Variovorax sp. PBS-H4]|uniref:GAF domain-containing protein n=1 Tax=Variovorax sp. PBS-H4 TaxID=434008 RepID=UPI001317B5FA|nr:GAF domain-containing protein [Variovorax sp. PBS-H4]VTU41512.1 hypothetical protein H4P1_00092 [Variovorax sp. PBS-H4]